MKVNTINRNCAFKALFIHPENEEYTKSFLNQYKDIVDKAAEDKDLYISSDERVVEKGPDYSISRPVINVAIHPIEVDNGEENGYKLDKSYNTIFTSAFSYIPSTQNEKEEKFADILQKALSIIG